MSPPRGGGEAGAAPSVRAGPGRSLGGGVAAGGTRRPGQARLGGAARSERNDLDWPLLQSNGLLRDQTRRRVSRIISEISK